MPSFSEYVNNNSWWDTDPDPFDRFGTALSKWSHKERELRVATETLVDQYDPDRFATLKAAESYAALFFNTTLSHVIQTGSVLEGD